jgi:hypothetical protein
MWWIWLVPAAMVLGALGAMSYALRGVAREARALDEALATWGRMAVAAADLEHEARVVERKLQRVARR